MKQLIVILFLGFFCISIQAQLSTQEIPYSWGVYDRRMSNMYIPQVTLPRLDMETIHKEDSLNSGSDSPVRFGFTHDVNISLSNSGIWTTTAESGRLWNLRIYSEDALSLSLAYDKFLFPNGAKFFIYSEVACNQAKVRTKNS